MFADRLKYEHNVRLLLNVREPKGHEKLIIF